MRSEIFRRYAALFLACLALVPFPEKSLAREGQLPSAVYARVTQSSDSAPGNTAIKAVDASNATFSLTADLPGSYWSAELGRSWLLSRVEIVNRTSPSDVEMGGLTLRLFNIDDQIVFQTTLTNPGSGGTQSITLPTGLRVRSVWVGLLGAQLNGGGSHRVGLAEVHLFGELAMPFGPEPVAATTNLVRVYQSSDYDVIYPAANAIDGNTATFSHTLNFPNSYWMADLGAAYRIDRVEIVNRDSCCATRLSGLVLRVFDAASNSVASAVLVNPGLGGTWSYVLPANTLGRYIRVGLENGQTNADGNYYITLAEARIYSGTTNLLQAASTQVPVTNNLASFKPSYMVRLANSVPAASNANDDNISTETKTTTQTVDGYWEVDLGSTYAVYGVRTIGASGIGNRLTNTLVRLFDAAHDSVFAQRLTGTPDVFDSDLNGPWFARYLRVGLEDKQRTDPAGGLEWYIGMREVEVFGRPTNGVGILNFSAAPPQVSAGQSVTLSWGVEDVRHLEVHPSFGSVGASTAGTGIGSLIFTPTNSGEYILVASNTAGLFTRAVAVQVGSASLPLRLSEIVADNKFSLKDGYGDASDWIELRNPGDASINLAGYGLSDTPSQPMKWVFPATNIAAHSTLIIFASGRSTPIDPAGNLHATFHLNKDGGDLILTAPDGTNTVDMLANYPALDTDLAYGRDLEGTWTFMEPTPGKLNTGQTYLGWLHPLTFSRSRGFYDVPFTLTLTNSNPGALTLISLDGSVPSVPYGNGISIAGTKSVRAQAVRAGYKSARIQTETFIFIDNVIASPVMSTAITQNPAYAPRMRPGLLALPTISLVLPGQPEYEGKEGSVEILWPNGTAPVQANCEISRFGNSWEIFAKRSFRVKCHSNLGTSSIQTPLFNGFDRGVLTKQSFDELEFRSGSQDMVERGFYMAGRFVEDSMLDMGSLNPHGRFVHIYVNGIYWGQYDAREPLVQHFLADYLGGGADDYVNVRGNDNIGDTFIPGTPEPPNIQPWARVASLANSYAGVRPYLDVKSLTDFVLLWFYGDSESEYRSCGPLTAGSGFKFWMADADGFLRTSALGSDRTANTGPGGLFGALVTEGNTDFKTLLADRIYAHLFNDGALTPSRNDSRLAARMQEIHDSLLAECARWGYRTPANWESSAATIRSNLFPARTAQLASMLRARGLFPSFDPPAFNLYGGLVTNGFQPTLSTGAGTIYYTLDGSDPRLPGGGISPKALIWTPGAVTISQDLTLTARVRNTSGQWSALAQPRFLIASRRAPGPTDLLITEINYNPAGSDEYEFIELWNASTNLLDLSGVSLSNAVRFVFPNGYALPPAGFVLVVENTSSFASRYQNSGSPWFWPGLNVAGEWVGALDNAGETISLVASNGVELSSVPYKTSGDWPERADGQGSSLELTSFPNATNSAQQVTALLANGRNWSASSLYHGSPGRFDSFVKSARINEILSHPVSNETWVELVNGGTQAIDLSGCTLTDDLSLPVRWAFPTNTVIAPGQFVVLSSGQLGFTFSELGAAAYLLQLKGTNVMRFLDTVDFPAANLNESFGLFERSDGTHDFTELRVATAGSENALPRIGPVVFSEILFSPSPGFAQFIELANISDVAIPLFDPSHPTNVWKIEGIGSFAFPLNTTLPPCSTLLICSTNPADFRAQYGINPSTPVIGPWSGTLDQNGETLKLLQPGVPESGGTVPFYRVDHVSYRTNETWPLVASGTSLEKIPLQAYGNDPAYWRAGPANGTPGLAAPNRAPVIHVDGELTIPAQIPMTLNVTVADVDAPWQSVTLRATELPPGSSFSQGTFSWTPSAVQAGGNYAVSFAALDSAACGALETTQTFSISVQESFSLTARLDPGALELTFPALIGQTYRVEFSDTLEATDWQLLQEIANASVNQITILDPTAATASHRFYRVRWMR